MQLSIIIPIYNGEDFIEECLTSIFAPIKNSEDIEIIIVNDGSTDRTLEILLAMKDKNIRVINRNNSGVSISRNIGIKNAVGKYIMFVDSDDLLSHNWFSIILKDLDKDYDIIYYNKDIMKVDNKEKMLNHIIGFSNICIATPCSKLFNREFLLKNYIKFENNIINGEDMLFNVNSLLNANKYLIRNDSFYFYRIYLGSATKRFDKKLLKSDILFHEKLEKLLGDSYYNVKHAKSLQTYCKQNAVATIINRLAYLKSYSMFKINLNNLNDCCYLECIKAECLIKNKKNKIVFKLYRRKLYILIYIIINLLRKIKKILRTEKYTYIEV